VQNRSLNLSLLLLNFTVEEVPADTMSFLDDLSVDRVFHKGVPSQLWITVLLSIPHYPAHHNCSNKWANSAANRCSQCAICTPASAPTTEPKVKPSVTLLQCCAILCTNHSDKYWSQLLLQVPHQQLLQQVSQPTVKPSVAPSVPSCAPTTASKTQLTETKCWSKYRTVGCQVLPQ